VGISTAQNLTFIPDSLSLCDESDPGYKGCVFWRGGLYGYKSSDSFVIDDGTIPNQNGSASNAGFDTLNFEAYESRHPHPRLRSTFITRQISDG
jgi:hypothetical protein